MEYQNFTVAIFLTAYEVLKIAEVDPVERQRHFDKIAEKIRFSKVYLESFRADIWIDRGKLIQAKQFFQQNGIQTSGAIATTTAASTVSDFVSFCYSNPAHQEKLRKIVGITAELFDEVILDDFFFTNCRCESCIAAKGDLSWPEFRLRLMRQVTEELVIKPAKQINPDVRIIIKYPNWYDDYQSTGYDLEMQPRQFDALYTGTETRGNQYTQQTLQRYASYFVMRYLENVRPGYNGGAWFDPIDCLYNLGSYAEQGYLSLFAKAREITLFCWWLLEQEGLFAAIAGQIFDATDQFLAELDQPTGLPCYKPFHSSGENYLHSYLGMLGLPLEPTPHFPAAAPTVLLTQSAAGDPSILDQIKNQLRAGKNIIVTSGLVNVLQDRGLADITGIRHTDRKVSVDRFGVTMVDCSFRHYCGAPATLTLPVLEYSTNDCTPMIMGFSAAKGYPVLLQVKYGAGSLYILTIPDDYSELVQYPALVMNQIRSLAATDLPVLLEAPGQIGLFLYRNNTFIVESFLPYNSAVTIVIKKDDAQLVDLQNGQTMTGEPNGTVTRFQLHLKPTTYRVLRFI